MAIGVMSNGVRARQVFGGRRKTEGFYRGCDVVEVGRKSFRRAAALRSTVYLHIVLGLRILVSKMADGPKCLDPSGIDPRH